VYSNISAKDSRAHHLTCQLTITGGLGRPRNRSENALGHAAIGDLNQPAGALRSASIGTIDGSAVVLPAAFFAHGARVDLEIHG
jgi:hypothetical protein